MPDFIEGNPVLIVIDIMGSGNPKDKETGGIPYMGGQEQLIDRTIPVIESAKANQVPIVYIIEVHRPDHIDFGRELDGSEDVHDIEGRPATRVHPRLPYRDGDYLIPKRRYSAFFGTDLEILLKGLQADTLILCGELTDVCVHYTFVDAHQHNYYTRVIEDCVGGSTREAHEASLNAMEYLQTGARCTHSQAIQAFNALTRKTA